MTGVLLAKREKSIFVILIIMLIGFQTTLQSQDLAMTCNMQYGGRIFIAIIPETMESDLAYNGALIRGSMMVGTHLFHFVYPASDNRYEIRISVNRRSGDLFWEHGNPPFGASNRRNVHKRGLCDVRLK